MVFKERLKGVRGKCDRALISEDGKGSENGADPECFDESHGGEAVHEGFDREGLNTSSEAIFERAENGHGADTEENGAGDEAFTKGFRFVRASIAKCVLRMFAEAVDPLLQAENFSNDVADNEGGANDGQLFDDLEKAAVDALPNCLEADIDRESAKDDFDALLNCGRKLASREKADGASRDYRADVQNGSDHWWRVIRRGGK